MKSSLFFIAGLLALCFLTPKLKAQNETRLTEKEVMDLAAANVEKYRKGDVTLKFTDASDRPVHGLQVTVNQTSQDFLFGALGFDLVWDKTMTPDQELLFKKRFKDVFNFAIFPFYWGAYEPEAGHPLWQKMEPQLAWCRENGITCKGHPLAWTNDIGLPRYVQDMGPDESRKLLEARIINNVRGFRDEIAIWDVVNEPVNTVSWEMAYRDTSGENRYRSDVPLEDIEPWVENAFKTAAEANPGAHFILNEFMEIADPAIRQRFHDLLSMLLDKGAPVRGIGIQAHEPREEWFNPVDVWETFEAYKDLGLPMHITEFTPQSGGADITGGYRTGKWTPETQAECAEMMYRLAFGYPSVVSINWWGFSDKNSWLPGGGFLTENYDPKPAYEILKKLIRDEWMTKDLHQTTDKKGLATFRGFFGNYAVQVTTPGGQHYEYAMHVKKGDPNAFAFSLEE